MMKGLKEGYGQNARKQRLLIVASTGAVLLLTGGAFALTPPATLSHTTPAHATASGTPAAPAHAAAPVHSVGKSPRDEVIAGGHSTEQGPHEAGVLLFGVFADR